MRADRLLAIMLLLRARKRATAQELAEELDVSERTVYRDIEALSMAGVPIYTQPGTHGGVFLDENYRISLTGLSLPEIQSLFIASAAGPLQDLGLAKATEDALLKLFAALPSIHRDEAERMRQRVYIDPANWFQLVEPLPFLPLVQQAVWEDRIIDVVYRPVEGGYDARALEAYGLVAKANLWYLVGRRTDGETRTYRLSRFHHAALTDAFFERDPEFDLAAHWQESCHAFEAEMTAANPPYPAEVRAHPDLLAYFEMYMTGVYEQVGAPDEEGWVTLRVVFGSQGEAQRRVLGLGARIQVLEPRALAESVLAGARAVIARYADRPGGAKGAIS